MNLIDEHDAIIDGNQDKDDNHEDELININIVGDPDKSAQPSGLSFICMTLICLSVDIGLDHIAKCISHGRKTCSICLSLC